MVESTLPSLFRAWNNLQQKLSSGASSSRPFVAPKLTQLNEMVYQVYSPFPKEEPELEVVFFHGLQLRHSEDAYFRAWMSRDDSHLWIQTWLVELFPKARILLISYDSSTKKTYQSGRLDMYCTAENLVHSLTADEVRVGQVGCPVILVGHCLGGVVLKELCLSMGWMVGRKGVGTLGVGRIDDLFSNLRGMFFYGTPHNGCLLGDVLHSDFKGALLQDVQILNASSARRNEEFNDLKLQYGWHTCGLGESYETYVDCLGKHIQVVPEASARLSMDSYYSVNADHQEISKPDRKQASSLTCLRNFLNQVQEAGVIQGGAMTDCKSSGGYVDFEGRAKKVRNMLARKETEAVFITGFSGIGKTALAQQIFHAIRHNFQVTCFTSLDTIEEPASNCRQQILRQIVEGMDTRNMISSRNLSTVLYYLKGRKVLIVLDNVESQEQLDALQRDIWLKGTASKLIVTTTNARLCNPSNTFKVTYLSKIESQQLFRHYAFEGGEGPHDLRGLISQLIHQCGNFPLSLKILGGYVSTGNVHHRQLWLDLLDRLEKAQEVDSGQDYRLWAKLMVFYDVLQPSEKEIFLDIATFFHGFPFSFVELIWEGSRESPHIAWLNLEKRHLASVTGAGNIWMHSHLRNLGKSNACQWDKSVTKWKRICSSSSAKELISKHQGIVDTVTLNLRISQGESLSLQKSTFLNYVHLQYLSLEGVQATSSRVDLPRSLVYLRWTNGLFKICPLDFSCLENLVALQLRDCRSMESLSPSIVCATKLKWLELDGCLSLTKLPRGLSKCLQHLSLDKTAVTELPHDLGKLKSLTHLTVNSSHLTRIPQRLGGLEMLSLLNLSCQGLTTLPESIGNLTGLRDLRIRHTSLTSLPDSIGRLRELTGLDLQGSGALGLLPESIGQLQSLREMDLSYTGVKGLPQSIGDLANLSYLALSNTPLERLPDNIHNLHSLSSLFLMETQISTVPVGIGELVGLKNLYIGSPNLKAGPQMFRQLYSLEHLYIDIGPFANQHASGLYSQEAGGQDQDMALDIQSLLSQLPLLQGMRNLILDGRGFRQSWMQPLFCALQLMPSLRSLHLREFNLVETIPDELGTLANLETLCVVQCETLVELPESLGNLYRLRDLELQNNPRLKRLPESLSALTLSWVLAIAGCGSLQSMPRFVCHVSCRDGESATSQVTAETLQQSTTTSARPDPPERLPIQRWRYVQLDSWRLAKCFLECPWKHFADYVWYEIACKEMDKVRKKAIWREEQGYVLDTKVAMELFEGQDLNLGGRHNGLRDFSRPLYHSSSYRCAPHTSFKIVCCDSYPCALDHKVVRVMDLSEESEENIEGQDNLTDLNDESDEESQAGDSQSWILRHFRGLCTFLLCCTEQGPASD